MIRSRLYAKNGSTMAEERIEVQLKKILDEYDDEVQKTANDVMKTVSKEAVQKLKSPSPKKSGRYARGWALKSVGAHGSIVDIVVYNKTDWQLTHLLNNGHVIRNKYGTYGRKSGDNHIGNVEKWANQEVESEIERKL